MKSFLYKIAIKIKIIKFEIKQLHFKLSRDNSSINLLLVLHSIVCIFWVEYKLFLNILIGKIYLKSYLEIKICFGKTLGHLTNFLDSSNLSLERWNSTELHCWTLHCDSECTIGIHFPGSITLNSSPISKKQLWLFWITFYTSMWVMLESIENAWTLICFWKLKDGHSLSDSSIASWIHW